MNKKIIFVPKQKAGWQLQQQWQLEHPVSSSIIKINNNNKTGSHFYKIVHFFGCFRLNFSVQSTFKALGCDRNLKRKEIFSEK